MAVTVDRKIPNTGEYCEVRHVEIGRPVLGAKIAREGLIDTSVRLSERDFVETLAVTILEGSLDSIGKATLQSRIERVIVCGHIWLDKERWIDNIIGSVINLIGIEDPDQVMAIAALIAQRENHLRRKFELRFQRAPVNVRNPEVLRFEVHLHAAVLR